MPTAMTFNNLMGDMQDYSERGAPGDVTVFNQLPRVINRAERQIAEDLKILGFKRPLTDTLAIGASVRVKPDRWRSTVSMFYGMGAQRLPILPRAYEYCRAYWPDSSVRAAPKFYADYDYDRWLLVPTPDLAYNLEVTIYEQPAYLDAVNQTNWLTDYAPNLLLNATMMFLFELLRNMEESKIWEAKYVQEKTQINGQDLQRIIDNTTTRRMV